MGELLSKLGTWNWLIIGIVLMGIETFAPGVFMLWLGLAALIVGVLSFGIAWSWQAQILVFAVLSIAMVPLWRNFSRRNARPTDKPFLNKRAEGLIGRVFTLEKPIVDGIGTVKIDDTVWRVSGPDTPAGSRVKIVSADGASLQVGPA
ncbi:NfeD family protein [Bradyrhizobium sp. G127]|jgi:membrane protein implicated in regulation of membrane protease activity|uniref:NfeD family protein n=1 Tax=Bradyrhizobium sp. G127 TaxID=2904800 RepID=UPI001F2554F2|nr:NfeD family protein [Bradyrhizobium sp. G127]MCF2525453.1 NfeD family protein [Bradyrhizobium sp. G127]